MSKKRKKLIAVFLALILAIIGAIIFMPGNVKNYTAEQINANPQIINGITLEGVDLTGLRLENMTVRNTSFDRIILREAVFNNVVFENCDFIEARIWDSEFNKVQFNDCLFKATPHPISHYTRSIVETSVMNEVVFNNSVFRNASFQGIKGTRITLLNLRDFRNYGEGDLVFSLTDVRLRIDNCEFNNGARVDLATVDGDKGSIYATNSRFIRSGLGGRCVYIYMENCYLKGHLWGTAKAAVVKNCVLDDGAVFGQNVYIVDTEFAPVSSTMHRIGIGSPNSDHVYILGSRNPIPINFSSGNIYIYEADLLGPIWSRWADDKDPPPTINLRNVRFFGGKMRNIHINGGQWENVDIYPKVVISGSKNVLENIETYNLRFPEGDPWVEDPKHPQALADFKPMFIERDQPFQWPEIHVPTAEELGLTD